MNQHPAPLGDGTLLLAEIVSGTAVAHLLSSIPPWLGGSLAALVAGILLRLGDAPARVLSDALRDRLLARFPSLRPAPPASP